MAHLIMKGGEKLESKKLVESIITLENVLENKINMFLVMNNEYNFKDLKITLLTFKNDDGNLVSVNVSVAPKFELKKGGQINA